jgi:quercetin dioxygenase-like cupin family protein
MATDASAQGTQPAATPGVTRKISSQTDGPTPGYVTLLVEATIDPGVTVARHTHPGIESVYVLEGGFGLPIQGQPTRTIKTGDGFQIPPETPHAGGKPGDTNSRFLITYAVEKGNAAGRGLAQLLDSRALLRLDHQALTTIQRSRLERIIIAARKARRIPSGARFSMPTLTPWVAPEREAMALGLDGSALDCSRRAGGGQRLPPTEGSQATFQCCLCSSKRTKVKTHTAFLLAQA